MEVTSMTTSENPVRRLIQQTYSNPLLTEADYECIDDIYRSALLSVCSGMNDSQPWDQHQEKILYQELTKRLNCYYQKRMNAMFS